MIEDDSAEIAERWCRAQEGDWEVIDVAGVGGTAPVFTVSSPTGFLALKLFDEAFSTGDRREETKKRIELQCERLRDHQCPQIVQIVSGGEFEDRLFLLMEKAQGVELEKALKEIPREKIRKIVDQVARAAIYLRSVDLCHRDIKSANIFVAEDFDSIKLLDLSVIRDINDPVGLGTDHGDSLPVVATSRYSPPDYLFRLLDPGPELWQALDIYQLGGVLHDLIMREPMFESEYQKTKDNRYRFAWLVATEQPLVRAVDVDSDLLQLARRALDKDWKKRSKLRLEDFLDDAQIHRRRAFEALGAQARSAPAEKDRPLVVEAAFEAVLGHAKDLIKDGLFKLRITCSHAMEPGPNGAWSRILCFQWSAPPSAGSGISEVCFTVAAQLNNLYLEPSIGLVIKVSGIVEGERRESEIDLPERKYGENTAEEVAEDALNNLPELAAQILRSSG